MRGASAIQALLDKTRNPELRVYVIWEPVLDTDWSAPGKATMGRVADRRVTQFWDKDRSLSRALGGPARMRQIAAANDIRFAMNDIIWDAALVYPANATNPAFLAAPVLRVASELPRYFNLDNGGYNDRRPADRDRALPR